MLTVKEKKVTVTLMLSSNINSTLNKLADNLNRTRSELVETALIDMFKREDSYEK